MVIAIDENILIALLTIFFIPIIGFVAKMFMQMRDNQSKIQEIEVMRQHIADMLKKITSLENEMSGTRVKIENIDKMAVKIRDYVLEQKRKTESGFIG